MYRVSEHQDCTLRLQLTSDDEVARLSVGFISMLEQIQEASNRSGRM